jgi:opacity protein-like surface antigen
MRRVLACLIGFTFLMFAATDGASSQTKFAFGLRTGLNFATMSFDPVPYANTPQISQGGRTGFMVGAAGELEFQKMFAVELDIMYTMAGAKFSQTTPEATDEVHISELQFPIVFKVKFLPGNKIRPYGFAGPVLGIVTSATDIIDVPGQGYHQETDLKSSTQGIQVSSMDFALTFGGGAEYLFTPKFGVLLDLRYSLGLSNIASLPAGVQGATTPTWHTRGFMIQVGGMYHI